MRAPQREPHRPALVELVAPRVAAEIVVVLQDENPGILAETLPVIVGGREPRNARADHNEVVVLVQHARRRKSGAIAQGVRGFE